MWLATMLHDFCIHCYYSNYAMAVICTWWLQILFVQHRLCIRYEILINSSHLRPLYIQWYFFRHVLTITWYRLTFAFWKQHKYTKHHCSSYKCFIRHALLCMMYEAFVNRTVVYITYLKTVCTTVSVWKIMKVFFICGVVVWSVDGVYERICWAISQRHPIYQ